MLFEKKSFHVFSNVGNSFGSKSILEVSWCAAGNMSEISMGINPNCGLYWHTWNDSWELTLIVDYIGILEMIQSL